MLTALMATPLSRYSANCSAMRTPTISCASSVEPAICGVAITASRPNSGKPSAGGSGVKTSIATPATLPDSMASLSAATSMSSPREQLTRRTPFFILANALVESIWRVSGVSEVCSEM